MFILVPIAIGTKNSLSASGENHNPPQADNRFVDHLDS